VTFEIPKIKRSRFIADVAPASDPEAARAHISAIRKQHHAARHLCWAWRLQPDGSSSRSSDDGEPSGSAGRPILQAIEAADLTDVVVAVTRYFGGTKLGVGGLVRAYGGAAAQGLARAAVEVVVPTRTVHAILRYDLLGLLETVCARRSVARPEPEYGERVHFRFEIPAAEAEAFAAALTEASSAQIEIRLDS
jgi:uncharacterized YigZ family protein